MDLTLVLWFAALVAVLIIDWWRGWAAVRIIAVLMAIVQLWFAQPALGPIVRYVRGLPPKQRITTLAMGGVDTVQLDGYQSGVLTLAREIQQDSEGKALDQLIAVGVLSWLAVSPRRRASASVQSKTGGDAAAA